MESISVDYLGQHNCRSRISSVFHLNVQHTYNLLNEGKNSFPIRNFLIWCLICPFILLKKANFFIELISVFTINHIIVVYILYAFLTIILQRFSSDADWRKNKNNPVFQASLSLTNLIPRVIVAIHALMSPKKVLSSWGAKTSNTARQRKMSSWNQAEEWVVMEGVNRWDSEETWRGGVASIIITMFLNPGLEEFLTSKAIWLVTSLDRVCSLYVLNIIPYMTPIFVWMVHLTANLTRPS